MSPRGCRVKQHNECISLRCPKIRAADPRINTTKPFLSCDVACRSMITRATGKWWSQTGSNRRHPACKAGALPAELWPHLLPPFHQPFRTSGARTPAIVLPSRRRASMDHSGGFGRVMIDAVRPARQKDGALAQLGERLLCKQDVVGSIPSGSTTNIRLDRNFGSRLNDDRF